MKSDFLKVTWPVSSKLRLEPGFRNPNLASLLAFSLIAWYFMCAYMYTGILSSF